MTRSAKNKQAPQQGVLEKKQSTSTELTGGAGFTYEDKVVAYYLAALLRGEKAMLQHGSVSSVAVQQAGHGQPMDDLVVEFRDTDGPRMLGLQVKSTITVSGAATNKDFRDVLNRARETRQAPGFQGDRDAYGYVVENVAEAGHRSLSVSSPSFPLSSAAWYRSLMATHRLLLESLPASPSVSRLRAEGKITADMTSVWIGFGAIELKREVRLEHRRFPNGGSWSFFLCPRCERRVRLLRLNDGRPMCSYCCGNFHRISYGSPEQRSTAREQRIEKLRKLIDEGPARLNPRPGRVLDRRMWLTFALRRAKIMKRWEVLRDLRAGKLPR